MLNDSFAAKSKFLVFEHRDNCECTLVNTEGMFTAESSFQPIQPKPHPVAHHHHFSLKQKLDFFFFLTYRYISVLPFYNAVYDMHMRGNCGVSGYLFGFHSKTLQSRLINMVFPHVFETRGGRLHRRYRCGCITIPYQNVFFWLLWWKRVGLAERELPGFKDTELTE